MTEIEPLQLKQLLESNRPPLLIDVRQPEEHESVAIPGSKLIPLGELSEQLGQFKELVKEHSSEVVLYCHVGERSALAIEWLKEQGIEGLRNLKGGLKAYAREADSSLASY